MVEQMLAKYLARVRLPPHALGVRSLRVIYWKSTPSYAHFTLEQSALWEAVVASPF